MNHIVGHWYKALLSIVSNEESLIGTTSRAQMPFVFNLETISHYYGTFSDNDFEDGDIPDCTALCFKNGQEYHILVPYEKFDKVFTEYLTMNNKLGF